MKRSKALVLSLGAMLFAAAAAFGNFWETNQVMVRIAHAPALGMHVKRVAFEPSLGPCSGLLTEQVINDFLRQHIEVVDQQHLGEILAQQHLSAAGYQDPETAVALGKLLGPSALVDLHVDQCRADHQRYYKDEPSWKKDTPPTRRYYAKTNFYLDGELQITDLATGRILNAETFSGDESQVNNSTSGQPVFPSSEDLRNAGIQKVLVAIHRMFFTWHTNEQLLFHDDDKCNLKQAYRLIHAGNVADAIQQSEANLRECIAEGRGDKMIERATYNMALADMVDGDYDQAMPLLQQALQRHDSGRIRTAMQLCRQGQAYEGYQRAQEALANVVLPPLPLASAIGAPPPPSTEPVAAAAAPVPAPTAPVTAAASGGESVATRLKQLKNLYRQGLISKKEYQTKQAQILNSL